MVVFMKISKSKSGAPASGAKKTKANSGPSGVDFQALFQAQLQGVNSVVAPAEVAAVAERDAVAPELRMAGVQLAEKSIDSLDNFAKALADENLLLADLEPIIKALEEESQGLLDLKEQLPADDKLTDLIEKVPEPFH